MRTVGRWGTSFSMSLIAACSAPPRAGGPAASTLDVRLDPRPERAVFVRVPAVGGGWRLRLPESVYADPCASLIEWDENAVVSEWKPYGAGGVRCEAASRKETPAIVYVASIRPDGDALELSLRVSNTGKVALANVAAHVCLSHDYGEHEESYADPGHARTYVVRDGRMACLAGIQTGRRAQYLVKGARPVTMLTEGAFAGFWGPLAAEPVDEPLVAGVSASGKHLVALAWGEGAEVLQNGDAGNRCIHVNPAFGDLRPGESREVRGRMWFLPNDTAGLLARYRADREAGRLGRRAVTIAAGDLSVTFRDNSESPKPNLSGLDALFNTREAPDFDAFDPDPPGSSAGLNFEHIIAGHDDPHNAFSPRHHRQDLVPLPDGRSVRLERRREDDPWGVSSALTYTVTPPHYVDFEFRCVPHDAARFGARGYAIFFWADYMNDVADVPINFRGVTGPGEAETWIAGDAPQMAPAYPDWNKGGTYRHVDAAPLAYDDALKFRLNSWSYEWPRFTRPFYYGRTAREMAFVLMFDRAHTPEDEIRFSLFKFKLPGKRRPAWDFQYVIHRVEAGREYGFRGRLVWKKFAGPEDCLDEYRRWSEAR